MERILLATVVALSVSACKSNGGEQAPCKDPLTEQDAISTFTRLQKGAGSALCAKLLPDLKAALVGSLATEIGCAYHHVLHRCEVYPEEEGAAKVLGALGWPGATPPERARLATLWVRQVVFPYTGEEIIESETPEFARAKQTFTPLTGEPAGDGGVRVTVWVRHSGFHELTVEHHEIVFTGAGQLTSERTVAKLDLSAEPLTKVVLSVETERDDPRLTSAEIARGIESRYVRRVRNCHEAELKNSPDAAGTVRLSLSIGAYGRVAQVDLEGFGNATLDACIKTLAEKWRFHPSDGNDSFAMKATVELLLSVR